VTDIVEFLRARYAEDRQQAQAELDDNRSLHARRQRAQRTLDDADAKLRIVDLYAEHADYDTLDEPYEYATGRIVGLGVALRLLAVQFAGHEDYREEWRP
jgi:hypothetical protein